MESTAQASISSKTQLQPSALLVLIGLLRQLATSLSKRTKSLREEGVDPERCRGPRMDDPTKDLLFRRRMKVPLVTRPQLTTIPHESNPNSSSWASPASSTTWATTNISSTKSKSTITLPTKRPSKFCLLTISKHQKLTRIKIWCILTHRYASAKSTSLPRRSKTSGSSWTTTKTWSGANNHARPTSRRSNKMKTWNSNWWERLSDTDHARTARRVIARNAPKIRILTRLSRTRF